MRNTNVSVVPNQHSVPHTRIVSMYYKMCSSCHSVGIFFCSCIDLSWTAGRWYREYRSFWSCWRRWFFANRSRLCSCILSALYWDAFRTGYVKNQTSSGDSSVYFQPENICFRVAVVRRCIVFWLLHTFGSRNNAYLIKQWNWKLALTGRSHVCLKYDCRSRSCCMV